MYKIISNLFDIINVEVLSKIAFYKFGQMIPVILYKLNKKMRYSYKTVPLTVDTCSSLPCSESTVWSEAGHFPWRPPAASESQSSFYWLG